jgi:hypothetical protein
VEQVITSLPEFIDEPLLVQARFLFDEAVQPTAFIWRGRNYAVTDWGRQWQEEASGITWSCYLVRTANLETFELRLDQATGRWVLARAWRNRTSDT